MAIDDGRKGGGRNGLRLMFATAFVAVVLGGLVLDPRPPAAARATTASSEFDYLRTPATDPSLPSADSGTYPAAPEEQAQPF